MVMKIIGIVVLVIVIAGLTVAVIKHVNMQKCEEIQEECAKEKCRIDNAIVSQSYYKERLLACMEMKIIEQEYNKIT